MQKSFSCAADEFVPGRAGWRVTVGLSCADDCVAIRTSPVHPLCLQWDAVYGSADKVVGFQAGETIDWRAHFLHICKEKIPACEIESLARLARMLREEFTKADIVTDSIAELRLSAFRPSNQFGNILGS